MAMAEKSWRTMEVRNGRGSEGRLTSTRGRCRWVRGSEFEHKEGIGYLTEGLGTSLFALSFYLLLPLTMV